MSTFDTKFEQVLSSRGVNFKKSIRFSKWNINLLKMLQILWGHHKRSLPSYFRITKNPRAPLTPSWPTFHFVFWLFLHFSPFWLFHWSIWCAFLRLCCRGMQLWLYPKKSEKMSVDAHACQSVLSFLELINNIKLWLMLFTDMTLLLFKTQR